MQLRYHPYPLQLQHTFTVSGCSRSQTPDVLIAITHHGVTGFGEASMPPYLGESIESVCAFLERVDLSTFEDPLRTDDILSYVYRHPLDSLYELRLIPSLTDYEIRDMLPFVTITNHLTVSPLNGETLDGRGTNNQSPIEAPVSLHIIRHHGSSVHRLRRDDVPYECQCRHDQVPAG